MQLFWRGPMNGLPALWDLGQELMQPLTPSHCREEEVSLARWKRDIDDDTAARRGLRDYVSTINEINTRRRGHAVPPWSAPRVCWKTLLIPHDELIILNAFHVKLSRRICLSSDDLFLLNEHCNSVQ